MPDVAASSVILNDDLSSNINIYYHALRISCELLVELCECGNPSCSQFTTAFDSVWNVLMRSRHKGVVDHVSDCFQQISTIARRRSSDFSQLPLIYLQKTKELFIDKEVSTRNLSFNRILRCLAEVSDSLSFTVTFIIETAATSKCSRVVLRALKTLKFILNAAELDLSSHYDLIFSSLCETFRSSDWIVRSSAAHCFAVLVSSIITDGESGYPLCSFIKSTPNIWKELCRRISVVRIFDYELMFLISLIERLRIVHISLYTVSEMSNVQDLVKRLVFLLISCKNQRLSRMLVTCLINLSPRTDEMCQKLYSLLNLATAANIRGSLQYAIDKITSELYGLSPVIFDGSLENILRNEFAQPISEAANLIHPNISNEQFNNVFTIAESDALSAKELRRLRSAHIFVLIPVSLIRQTSSLYIRYFCCVCSLLMDEVENVRRVASRCTFSFNPSDDLQGCSRSPYRTLKDLIHDVISHGFSPSTLLKVWHEWSEQTYSIRRKYNRYFEDSLIDSFMSRYS